MPTVAALADIVGGTVVGDGSREIKDLADLRSAGPSDISFLSNPKYQRQFDETKAGAVLVAGELPSRTTLVVCDDPYLAMAKVATTLHPPRAHDKGVEPGAHVHPSAEVHPTSTIRAGAVVDAEARIGARCVVETGAIVGYGARLGDDVLMHPGAKLLERCELGDRVILQAGAVIGSDGFGYAPDGSGRRHKIPQVGVVIIEEDCEIGANTTIDRATFGTTRIGAGSKIDNQVQIAHNVTLGRDCVVVSQSGVAGSTKLGDRVILGAQTGVVGHIELTSDVILGARGAIGNSIKEPGIFLGTPSMDARRWKRMIVAQKYLPEMRTRLRELEQKVATLSGAAGEE